MPLFIINFARSRQLLQGTIHRESELEAFPFRAGRHYVKSPLLRAPLFQLSSNLASNGVAKMCKGIYFFYVFISEHAGGVPVGNCASDIDYDLWLAQKTPDTRLIHADLQLLPRSPAAKPDRSVTRAQPAQSLNLLPQS